MREKSKPHSARAAGFNTPNRFAATRLEPLDTGADGDEGLPRVPTMFFTDTSKSILVKNTSPDVPFSYSINPYRGCEHGCIYCYARPSHEYLGFSAGLDFETKIMVKTDAPDLLRREFGRRSWEPQLVAFSGNTDCYQPVERSLRLTRACLGVFLRFGNPAGIITKNALVQRDIDILREMAQQNLVNVMFSVTTLDPELARRLEPRTSAPAKKLEAMNALAQAGIRTGVMVAPVIPGLTDSEMPEILRQAAEHGASSAGYILLRLPGPVEPLFVEWLGREYPDRAAKVVNRIKDTRKGGMNDPRFGSRFKGEGEIARMTGELFRVNAARYGLDKRWEGLSTEHFRREGQLSLF